MWQGSWRGVHHRYPAATAVVGLVTLAALILGALNVQRFPLIGDGTTYTAHFTEVGGLNEDSPVRVAGVKVGRVTGIELAGEQVEVTFTAGDTWLGDRSTAAIKLGSLLGNRYIALEPRGGAELDVAIPRERTASLYDVSTAVQDLGRSLGDIDTAQLAHSFRVMSETFGDTLDEVRGTLDGLSALSTSVAKRDEELRTLLSRTSSVSRTVAERDAEVERLLADGNVLLGELRDRQEVIGSLLDGTRALSAELTGLVEDNQAQLGPVLQQLDRVAGQLARNQHNLRASIDRIEPLYRLFSNTMGNGRWIDVYICGLLPPAVGPVNPEGCKP